MLKKKSHHISGLLKIAVAVLLAGTVLILSVSAVGNKDKEKINNIRINIKAVDGHQYISQKEVFSVLYKSAGKGLKHQTIGSLDFPLLEKQLMKVKWIKRADMFVDNQNILQVNIEQNKPIARIFSSGTYSFFISDNAVVLPFNNEVAVWLPMFTNFSGNPDKLNSNDSSVLNDIIRIATYLNGNDFWKAQIDQVDITPSGGFEMIPKLGNQTIRFGSADNCEIKFSKLLAFYKQIENKTGWDRYSLIDLRFQNQVVAERRGAAEVKSDSLATIRIMKSIIENAKKNEQDTSFFQLPEKPISEKIKPILREEENSLETISETIPEKPDQVPSSDISVSPPAAEIGESGKKMNEPENSPDKVSATSVKANTEKSNANKLKMKKADGVKPNVKSAAKRPVENTENKIPKAVMPPKNDN
jgi:cell division protein FtsQ